MKGVKVNERYFKEVAAEFPEVAEMELSRFMELRKKMVGAIRMVTGTYKLNEAAKERDVDEVEELLEKGADPNFHDTRARQMGRCAIHNVFSRKMKSPGDRSYADRIVQLLIEWGFDVNRRSSKRGEVPLEMALEKDCWYSAKYLVEAGADVTDRCVDIIIRNAVPEIMEWMIESEKFPDDLIFHRALYNRNIDVLKKMLVISDPPKNAYQLVMDGYWNSDSRIILNVLQILFKDGRADPVVGDHAVFTWLIKYGIKETGRKEDFLDLFREMLKDPRVDLTRNNNLFLKLLLKSLGSVFLPDWVDFLLSEVPQIKNTSTVDPKTGYSVYHVYLDYLYQSQYYYGGYRGYDSNKPILVQGHQLTVLKKLVEAGFPYETENNGGIMPSEKARIKYFSQDVIDILSGKKFDEEKN